MKDHVSLQERLKDLRVEKGLKLEELAEKTGISKSALASYENEENRNKEINHGNLITLAVAALLPSPTVMLAVYSPASVGSAPFSNIC